MKAKIKTKIDYLRVIADAVFGWAFGWVLGVALAAVCDGHWHQLFVVFASLVVIAVAYVDMCQELREGTDNTLYHEKEKE